MKTPHNQTRSRSPFFCVSDNSELHSVYPLPEESAFLGLFEGKWKAKREAKQSDSDSSSEDMSSGGSGLFGSILGGLFGVAGGIAPILPALGIGSKARMNEIQAQSAADAKLYNAQLFTTQP